MGGGKQCAKSVKVSCSAFWYSQTILLCFLVQPAVKIKNPVFFLLNGKRGGPRSLKGKLALEHQAAAGNLTGREGLAVRPGKAICVQLGKRWLLVLVVTLALAKHQPVQAAGGTDHELDCLA